MGGLNIGHGGPIWTVNRTIVVPQALTRGEWPRRAVIRGRRLLRGGLGASGRAGPPARRSSRLQGPTTPDDPPDDSGNVSEGGTDLPANTSTTGRVES